MKQSITSKNVRVLIICPTNRGGHLEHADNLALALTQEVGNRTILLSRSGADQYLNAASSGAVQVVTTLPPLVDDDNRAPRLMKQLGRLALEMFRICQVLVREKDLNLLILEEARYPVLWPFRVVRLNLAIATFAHNVEPHNRTTGSLETWIKEFLERQTRRSSDSLLCHGAVQRERLQSIYSSKPIIELPLPGESPFDWKSTFASHPAPEPFGLCLGEIRQNKGFDLAVRSFEKSLGRLVVAGPIVEVRYGAMLEALISTAENVDFSAGFLLPEEFEKLLDSCHYLILPYREFLAQSGVLARSMTKNKIVIVSDLPSLLEQTGNYPHNLVFKSGDVASLSAAVAKAQKLSSPPPAAAEIGSTWGDVAKLLLSALKDKSNA